MTIDAPTINAVFSGLVVLLGAVGALVGVRSRRAGVQRRDFRALQRRYLAALTHIFTLETRLAGAGVEPPRRPEALEEGDDEEPVGGPLPPVPSPSGG